jgi:proteic killer suppression protein
MINPNGEKRKLICSKLAPVRLAFLYAPCYYTCMIAGFRDADTERLWTTGRCRRLPAKLNRRALRKLYILNAALALENLNVPPGNRLEKLRGDREGRHSIRINDQYRVCFVWRDGNAHEVEIVDYH